MGSNKVRFRAIEEEIRSADHNQRTEVPFEFAESALISAILYLKGGKNLILVSFPSFHLTRVQLGHWERRGIVPDYAKALVLSRFLDVPAGALNWPGYNLEDGYLTFDAVVRESLQTLRRKRDWGIWSDWILSKKRLFK